MVAVVYFLIQNIILSFFYLAEIAILVGLSVPRLLDYPSIRVWSGVHALEKSSSSSTLDTNYIITDSGFVNSSPSMLSSCIFCSTKDLESKPLTEESNGCTAFSAVSFSSSSWPCCRSGLAWSLSVWKMVHTAPSSIILALLQRSWNFNHQSPNWQWLTMSCTCASHSKS